jgi:mono/diheme cytochrome c family protein
MKMSLQQGCLLFLITVVFLTGCDEFQSGRVIETQTGTAVKRVQDEALISQGAKVYQANCAVCHGANAQGNANWRKKGPDGKYPPPPLNGSGHTWHHALPQLKEMIAEGSPPDQGNMPAWDDKLTDHEIDAVIAWFQSLWPDEVYAAWYEMQERARGQP